MSRAKITGKKTAHLLQSEMAKMQNAGEIISHACKVFMHRRKTVILAQSMILTFNARRKYKDIKTRRHVAKEILSTEEYYVTNLKYMSEKLYDPLLAEATQSRSLNPEDVKKIFSQIKVIVGVNESLLAQLQTQIRKWNIEQCLGQIFINMTEFLKVYIQYVNNFDNALKVIEKVRNNDVFAKFLKSKDLDDNKLQSLLIQPIQRIPRYVLLLQTIQKHTAPEHKDFPLISQALTRIKEIADLINSRKKEFDSSRDMLLVAKQLDPPVKDLIVPQRSLVSRGGLFLIQKEKGRDLFLEYHHVLFSDMLLLTSKDVLFDKYNIKHTVPLANSQVELNEDQLLVVLIGPDKKRWQFKLKSTDEAKKFSANLAQAVLTVNATLPSQFGNVRRRVADFQRVMRGQDGGGPVQGPSDSVQVLLRDSDGLVWTGLGNGAVQLWDSKKYTCLKEVAVVRDRIYVLVEVEGTVWCSSGLQTVHVIDKKSSAVVKTLDAEKEVIKAMILVNNKPLQSDEELDMLRLMKLSSPRSKSKMTVVKMRKDRGRIGPQTDALFDEEESSGPRHDVWTASCVEGLIIIWDTQSYKEKGRIRVPQGVSAMCQCVNFIWAGSVDGDVFVISLDTHEVVETIKGHKGLINAVIAEDNKVWSASNDFILIHDAETRKLVKKIDCPGKCLSLTAVPSRSQVWSGMWTKEIVIWDAKKLEFVQELKDRHKDGVRTIIQTSENEMWTGGRELDRAIVVWQLAALAPTPSTTQTSMELPSLRNTTLFSTLRGDSFVPEK